MSPDPTREGAEENLQRGELVTNPRKIPPGKRPRRGALKIASLNIKGAGSASTEHKWGEISYMMMRERIDVLAVQETHLTEEHRKRLNATYEKRLHFISTLDKSTPNKMGVAIILNKGTTRWKEISSEVVIRGRALLVDVPWSQDVTITCLAIYALNQTQKNKEFWEQLSEHWKREKWEKPTCILGDCNVIEDSIDRMPAHNDPTTPVNALTDLKGQLSVIDGWRRENPMDINFTYCTGNGSIQSRIDRIYIQEDLIKYSHNWRIEETEIQTDHRLISVNLVNPWVPHQGPGRYAMPLFLLENKTLERELYKLGKKYYNEIKRAKTHRTADVNPQKVHKELKDKMISTIRQHAKTLTLKMDKKIDDLEADRQRILNGSEENDEHKSTEAAMLDEKIKEIKRTKMLRMKDNTETKFFLEGEMLRKPWINANKQATKRDMIAALRDPNRPDSPLTQRSDKMTNIASKYHENLQEKDREDPLEQTLSINKVLTHIKRKLSKENEQLMRENITKEEVREAIEKLPNGKAAGLDGIPQEIWKGLLNARPRGKDERGENANQEDNPQERTSFDIADYLTILYNDIEDFGVDPETGFADAWLCPIYKKGDRTDIGNYRPITVLNTDYKIYTKALTNKLTLVVPGIIHQDQAGFMKGRHIGDQTELANLMTKWGEKKEVNGMIVCLD